MAREYYERSDETFRVISGHEAEFAREADKSVSFYNKIKNGVEKDPFSHFRAFFRVACRTSADVEIYLRELEGILRHYRPVPTETDIATSLLEKIQSDSQTMSVLVESLADRHLDAAECHEILAKLERNRKVTDAIRAEVVRRLAEQRLEAVA